MNDVVTRTPVLRGALVAALVSAAPLLSACGTGKHAETSQEHTTITPRNDAVGDVRVRAAYVAPDPADPTKGYVVAAITNVGSAADTLTGVTSTAGTVNAGSGTAIPPQQLVSFVDPSTGMSGNQLPLTATSPLTVGLSVSVTFTFQNAGALTMQLPIEPTTGTTATETPAPTGS